MVEGLEDGRWALVSKVHHCMVDGVSGTDLLRGDARPRARAAAGRALDTWRAGAGAVRRPSSCARPSATSSRARTSSSAALRAAARARRQLAELFADAASRRGRRWPALVRADRPSRRSTARSARTAAGTGRARTLADVKAVRTALGGTVNDVVLTVLTQRVPRPARGARRVPVEAASCARSCRCRCASPDERGTYNNRVSAMFAELPGRHRRPGRAARRDPGADGRAQGVEAGRRGRGADVAVGLRARDAARARRRASRPASPQRNVNTVTTNVPGPQFPLYARRPADARGVPVRAARRPRAHRRRDLLLRRRRSTSASPATTTPRPTSTSCAGGVEDGMSELLKLAGEDGSDEAGASAEPPAAKQY